MTGDKQDEDSPGGLLRLQAVRILCQMNPSQALNVRALCVSMKCYPGTTTIYHMHCMYIKLITMNWFKIICVVMDNAVLHIHGFWKDQTVMSHQHMQVIKRLLRTRG